MNMMLQVLREIKLHPQNILVCGLNYSFEHINPSLGRSSTMLICFSFFFFILFSFAPDTLCLLLSGPYRLLCSLASGSRSLKPSQISEQCFWVIFQPLWHTFMLIWPQIIQPSSCEPSVLSWVVHILRPSASWWWSAEWWFLLLRRQSSPQMSLLWCAAMSAS